MKVLTSTILSVCAVALLLAGGLALQHPHRVLAPNITKTLVAKALASSKAILQTQAVAPTPPAELRHLHVNEAGHVPILEYHEIASPPRGASRATLMMHRTVAEFRGDLERLYRDGYRPVNLSEFLDNKMDLPLGSSPVILTFDDARTSQFRYRSDGTIDPNCAVGILKKFHHDHSDWALKGTFYVLPEEAFGSERYAAQKMRALLALGFELGNHTRTHRYFNRMSDREIVKEIAQGKAITERMVPGANLDTLALPGGCVPRSHNYKILVSGNLNGISYTNRAVIDAWGGPAPAPITAKFDRLHIPRVLCVNGGGGIREALDDLKSHPGTRYVSDGDSNTVTVPQHLAVSIDHSRLKGLPLRTYESASSKPARSTKNPKHN